MWHAVIRTIRSIDLNDKICNLDDDQHYSLIEKTAHAGTNTQSRKSTGKKTPNIFLRLKLHDPFLRDYKTNMTWSSWVLEHASKNHQSRDPMMGAFDLRINQNPDCFLAIEPIFFELTST